MALKLLTSRTFLTGVSFCSGTYLANKFNESNPELLLSRVFAKQMNIKTDISSQISILSFMNNPTNIINWLKISKEKIKPMDYDQWLSTISKSEIFFMEKSIFSVISNKKEELSKKILSSSDAKKTIEEILQIYGNTIEAQHKIDKYIDEHIEKNNWIDYASIEILKNIHVENSSSPLINMLIVSILSCPLDLIEVIDELNGLTSTDKVSTIKKYYSSLEQWEKNFIIESVIKIAIEELKSKGKINDFYARVKTQLLTHPIVLDNLNSNITEHVNSFMFILSKLPTEYVSKILRAYLTSKNDINLLITNVMNEFGIVGIKLCQFYSEYPAMPAQYKKILQKFKESNEKMSYIDISKKIICSENTYLGKMLGVGSVKQVHLVKTDDKVSILGFTKNNIETDSQLILDILKQIPAYRKISRDFKQIILEELILLNESSAFNELSSIERFRNSNCLLFPEILDVSICTIQREFIRGTTISKLHETKQITKEITELIKKLHISTIECAFYDKLVFSDFHFGNVIYNSEYKKLVIIDAGQTTKVTSEDLNLFLVLILDLASKNNYMHQIFIDKLSERFGKQIKLDDSKYKSAYSMPMNISVSYILKLLEESGYELPVGFTACGKMLDIVCSQINLLGLDDKYFTDAMKSIIKSKLTYSDYLSIGYKYVINFGK